MTIELASNGQIAMNYYNTAIGSAVGAISFGGASYYHVVATYHAATDVTSFYLDGALTGEITTPDSLKAAVYLMADFSVGGTWAGYPDSTTPFPSAYSIDYMRVWQDASAFAPETVTGTGGSLGWFDVFAEEHPTTNARMAAKANW